jgi:hypothetical protein
MSTAGYGSIGRGNHDNQTYADIKHDYKFGNANTRELEDRLLTDPENPGQPLTSSSGEVGCLSPEQRIATRSSKARYKYCAIGAVLMGAALIAGGFYLPNFITSKIVSAVSKVKTIDSPDSPGYWGWQNNTAKDDMKVYMTYYFFSVGNADEVVQNGAKPELVEKGPYVFTESVNNVDTSWSEDKTVVRYRQCTWMNFVPEKSVGSLEDVVVMANIEVAGMLANLRAMNKSTLPIPGMTMGEMLQLTNGMCQEFNHVDCLKAFYNISVKDVLFGYNSTLMGVIAKLDKNPSLARFAGMLPNITDEKMCRETVNFDEQFTGVGDITRAATYNLVQNSSYFTKCAAATGCKELYQQEWDSMSDADMKKDHQYHFLWKDKEKGTPMPVGGQYYSTFPSQMTPGGDVTVMMPQFYRTLKLSNLGKEVVQHSGVPTRRYSLNPEDTQNVSENKANARYDLDGPQGQLNLTQAMFGIPNFVSKPFFMDAPDLSPSFNFKEDHNGMPFPKANRALHDTYLDIEPITGMAFSTRFRFQLNIYMEPFHGETAGADFFGKIPKAYYPMMWFEVSTDSTQHVQQMKLALAVMNNIPYVGPSLGGFLVLVGAWALFTHK